MKINLEQLEREMEQRGITGAELARMTGLHQATISNTRAKGSCDFVTLAKMANVLEVDVTALIPDELLNSKEA